MAFAETANLAVKLTLGGNFTSQMSKATSTLKKFNNDASRGYKAGAQIGTGIKRSAILAVAALGTLAGALAYSIKQGQEAANVQKIYANAITNSGTAAAQNAKDNQKQLASFEKLLAKQKAGSKGYKTVAAEIQNLKNQQAAFGPVTQAQVAALNAQQTALMNLAGVDDELIKSEQTRLIQMGFSGKATEKLTPLILDAAKATGKDLLTVTVAAGKAAGGNATALQRLGIQLDKTKFKANPLAETIRVLNQRFGGTTQALSGSFDVRMAALRENINNIAEDAGIKLLPALTRIVGVVGQKVVPALGKMVDKLLPEVSKGLDQFASALESGAAENAIRGITDALGPMIDLVKIAAQPVKEIVKAFLSLPKEVQTVLVGAFAVNKLTGGLVTNAAGGIIEAIGKGLLGGIKAPLVNVTGGVVNVGGGIPGVGGGGPGAIETGAAAAGGIGLGTVAAITAAAAVSTWAFLQTYNGPKAQGAFTPTIGSAFTAPTITVQGLKPLGDAINSVYQEEAESASQLRNIRHDLGRVLTPKQAKVVTQTAARHDKDTSAGIAAAIKKNNASDSAEVASQLRNVAHAAQVKPPIVVKAGAVSTSTDVKVYVTAGGIRKTVAVHRRYGPSTGSAGGYHDQGTGIGGA